MEMLATIADRSPVSTRRANCAYCHALLPVETRISRNHLHEARYCCYGCRVLGESAQKPVELSGSRSSPWFKIAIGAVLSGQAMLLGLAINLTPPAGEAKWLLHGALLVSTMAALGLLGLPLLRSAFEDIRCRRISLEQLFMAGILGAFAASVYSTISGLGAVYYEVVAVLVTVYSVGKTLGAQSRARALAEARRLQRTFETCQKIGLDGSNTSVNAAEIQPGDLVRVLAGQPIPVDGHITRGQAFLCETPLTGEPFAVVRRQGDKVFAGSYSEDGELLIQADVPGHARRLDGLIHALESACEKPSRLQSQADAIVRWFLPLVLVVSISTGIYWTGKAGWAMGLFNALAVLLVACPCAMGLATPVALWSGLAALASRGLVVRSGDVLERLAGLDQMVFDKTGTLSEERYSLIDLAVIAGERRAQVMALLQAVEKSSAHPVARAFHSLAEPAGQPACRTRSLKIVPALGVEGWVESASGQEHHVRIGQRALMADLSAEGDLLEQLRHYESDHLIYVEVDGRLQGVAAVREQLRASAIAAMQALEAQAVRCTVMTGDQPEKARRLLVAALSDGENHDLTERRRMVSLSSGKWIKGEGKEDQPAEPRSLSGVEGSLTPETKAVRITELRSAGHRIGFIGDGINDAPALSSADVGIALAHGAALTTASADAVLYGGDLRVTAWAVGLSRQVRDSIRSNLVFAAIYNFAAMFLAAIGLLHPIASALLMVLASFTVSWRALRSAEYPVDCCLPAKTSKSDQTSATGCWDWITSAATQAVLVMAQVPFLVYLGQLDVPAAILVWSLMLAIAIAMVCFRSDQAEFRRAAQMICIMLGLGNWGMLLGWWADFGFSPVQVCAHCHASGFSLLGFMQMPGMNLGMLLLGLPPMLIGGPVRGLKRLSKGLLSAIGMVWGMSWGSYIFSHWLGPFFSHAFLLSFAGMTVGMLAGMFFFCELGRAISLAQRLQPTKAF